MNHKVTNNTDPITIIEQSVTSSSNYLLEKFTRIITKLYKYELFKPLLDLVATKAIIGELAFKLQDKKIFDLDQGNCRTIEGGVTNKFCNHFRTTKRYIITIKKVSADIIMHEIAHMIEQESSLNFHKYFYDKIQSDITNNKLTRVKTLNQIIDQVMVAEVNLYPQSHHTSELFARYFQILTYSKEVAGNNSKGFDIIHAYGRFKRTEKWLWDHLYRNIIPKIDPKVANKSQEYIQADEHKWSEETIESFYKDSAETGKKWASSVISTKDDPFA